MFLRDPIHGLISISEEEKKIIDSPVFQRLRRIKQLSLASLVYIGANHSRFEHSLGAMHVAGLIAKTLGLDVQLARISSLIHDIGHVSFSHTGEIILEKFSLNHEELGKKMVEELNIYENYSKAELFNSLESFICSFSLGSDRIDYLKRDSYYTGVSFGVLEEDVLIRKMKLSRNKIEVEESALEALESFFISRFMMFFAVYMHKTVRIATSMLEKALLDAFERNKLSLEELIWDGDDVLLYKLSKSGGEASHLSQLLLKRNLYKKLCYLENNKFGVEVARELEKEGALISYPKKVEKAYDAYVSNKSVEEVSELISSLKKAEEKKSKILVSCDAKEIKKFENLLSKLLRR